jgi:hypothetical protein
MKVNGEEIKLFDADECTAKREVNKYSGTKGYYLKKTRIYKKRAKKPLKK